MRSFSADLAHPTGLQGGSTSENIALSFVFSLFILFFSAIAPSAILVPILAIDSLAGVRDDFNRYTLEKAQLGR